MKIAVIGATGYVGSKIFSEALARGHQVTAIAKDVAGLSPLANATYVHGDVTDAATLAAMVIGHDLVISAFNPGRDADGAGTRAIVEGVKRAGIKRLLSVGGAGSLFLSSGQRALDQSDFPAEWKEGSLRTAAYLEQLREEKELDWIFLCPAAMLIPGERTGHYRVGKDELLTDAHGDSKISLQDFAVAMLDEAEQPKHHRERFTVAY